MARFFKAEKDEINKLAGMLESASALLTEMEEEHGGEEGAFAELEKVTLANVKARLKELAKDGGDLRDEEAQVLSKYLTMCTSEATLRRDLAVAEDKLDALVYEHYPKLTETEIKALVVDDKWLAALDAAIHGEMDRISQALTQRVKELAERYETPLPQMVSRVVELETKVNHHLERMGFSWK